MVSTRPKVITPNYITHLSSCEVFVFGTEVTLPVIIMVELQEWLTNNLVPNGE